MLHSNDASRAITFESAGTRLFAIERGSGPAVVFLHGGLADHRSSLFRMGFIAASHRLVTPDVRGAGRSIHAGDLGWYLLADDVSALLDALGLDRAVVGGMSAGAAVALRFGLRHPSRTRGLLLVSPVYAGADAGLNEAQRAAMHRMDAVARRAPSEGIEVIFALYEALPSGLRGAALEMAAGFDPASVAATTRFLASGEQPFGTIADLAGLRAPALVVPGTDPEHPADVAELHARAIPDATLSGPDAQRAIEAFLDGLPHDERSSRHVVSPT